MEREVKLTISVVIENKVAKFSIEKIREQLEEKYGDPGRSEMFPVWDDGTVIIHL